MLCKREVLWIMGLDLITLLIIALKHGRPSRRAFRARSAPSKPIKREEKKMPVYAARKVSERSDFGPRVNMSACVLQRNKMKRTRSNARIIHSRYLRIRARILIVIGKISIREKRLMSMSSFFFFIYTIIRSPLRMCIAIGNKNAFFVNWW